MKAADMAKRFNEATDKDKVVRDILFDEIKSTNTVALTRGVKTNAGLLAVLKETDERWKAFCRLCPVVKPTAFKVGLHIAVPSSKELWP